MSASAREKPQERTTIIASWNIFDWTTDNITTEQRGRTDATIVVTMNAIIFSFDSSYSYIPVPRSSDTAT